MKAIRYERLPGKGRRALGIDYLLLADDHLLLARRHGYAENYQRFFFTDIQALTLYETRSREIVAAVTGALGLLLAWGVFGSDPGPMQVVWGILLAIVVPIFAFNWFAGPTVRCHLTTALQTVELASLRRRSRAHLILSRLTEAIAEAQKGIAEPNAEASIPEAMAPAAQASVPMAPVPAPRRASPPPLPTLYKGLWHWLLFGLLLVDSVVTFWQLQSPSTPVTMVGTGLFLVEVMVAITAVVRQRVLTVPKTLRNLASAAVVFLLILLVASWIVGTATGFTSALEAARGDGQVDPLAFATPNRPLGWVSLVGTTALGLSGLAAMAADRRRRRTSGLD